MYLLVFSDSHRSMTCMKQTVAAEHPDLVLHLGDHLQDAERLSELFPKQPIVAVPGNCDGWTTEPLVRELTLEGHKILMSHGHLWGVKSSYDAAIWKAMEAGADILLFGHTHTPYCAYREGIWVMNPGAARSRYGSIRIEDGEVHCALHQFP